MEKIQASIYEVPLGVKLMKDQLGAALLGAVEEEYFLRGGGFRESGKSDRAGSSFSELGLLQQALSFISHLLSCFARFLSSVKEL